MVATELEKKAIEIYHKSKGAIKKKKKKHWLDVTSETRSKYRRMAWLELKQK